MNLLLVALGGAAGSALRYSAGVLAGRIGPGGWPLATFSVNLWGGLLMGLLAGWLAQRGGEAAERWRLLLGVGLLGGFTTFSAFSLELALMVERRAWATAGLYAAASVLLSTLALFAGMAAARRAFG